MRAHVVTTPDGCNGEPAILHAVDVHRSYRQGGEVVPALRGVSLTVAPAEIVAVTGPSGSGKSTLLHLLGGLDAPDRGTVAVAGRSLAAMSDDELTVFRRRRIGVVFQAYNLLPDLTAEENVALPLLLDGHAMRAIRTRVAQALESVGMLPRGAHRPHQLSGGEQQRVAIARAVVVDPALLLADEPTGSLDSSARIRVLALLKDAAERRRCAVVLVTHDPNAAAYADRIVRMVDGRVDEGPVCSPARLASATNGSAAYRLRT